MLADGLSRWSYDRGDYTFCPKLFKQILKLFHPVGFTPTVDMFASPGNAQLKKFVCR